MTLTIMSFLGVLLQVINAVFPVLLIIMLLFIGSQISEINSTLQQLTSKLNHSLPKESNPGPSAFRLSGFNAKQFEQTPLRTLQHIAENLGSMSAFIMAPSHSNQSLWTIPPGLFYSEDNSIAASINLWENEEPVKTALSEEIVTFDTAASDLMLEPLKKAGINSLISVSIGYPERVAILVVCNKKTLKGRPAQFRYTRVDVDFAVVMGRALPEESVKKIIKKE